MIIEHRVFRLAAGADEAAFLAADRRVQTELAPFQRGFIRRTTARGPEGRWLVETLWFDEECAEEAAEARAAVADSLDALVDPDTERTDRWMTLD